MTKSLLPKISIIIPCLDGLEHIDELFHALEKQTFKNFDIIFINSECENSFKIEEKIHSFSHLDVKVFRTPPLCPGDARNLGVQHSSSTIIAFLDVRTIPNKYWLESSLEYKTANNYDIVLGKFICRASTIFQDLVRSATFGMDPSDSLPGSILSKEVFKSIGNFLNGARAGEDEEWLGRMRKSQYQIGSMSLANLNYIGLPQTIAGLVQKWFFYSIKSAPINVASSQKGAYFFAMFLLIIYFFFNWNYIFTNDQWDESPYFIPHINKIIWSIFFLIYLFLRGIFLPLRKGVNQDFLMPYNWLLISFIGLTIDLSKLPGRIAGYFYFLKTKLAN
jgi:glycosyltransferase involved in cell wall biosynthesis